MCPPLRCHKFLGGWRLAIGSLVITRPSQLTPPISFPSSLVTLRVEASLHVLADARPSLATLIGSSSRLGLDARRCPSPPLYDLVSRQKRGE